MGFWDTLGKFASAVMAEAQVNAQRRQDRQIREYERKLSSAERSERMNDPAYAAKVKNARAKFEAGKQGIADNTGVTYSTSGQVLIAGKTASQWDRQWINLGILGALTLSDLSPYSHKIGLYKAEMGGKIKYIGRAIEYSNGGFRKRLRDYVRDSDSARVHRSGGKMHENADHISLSILIVGDSESDVGAVKSLEKALIAKYHPDWNIQFNS
ncbi:MAG: hypothetical protein ACOX44_00400 [Limnochordia bacterium]